MPCLESGVFPSLWKMTNLVSVHKKESKQLVKNYRLVSLPPVCGKIFEQSVYNEMHSCLLIDNNLISLNQ